MAVLPIYTYGTDVLRKKTKPITELDDTTVALIMNMFETMHKANGIGLAANQIGRSVALAVIDMSALEEHKDEKPLVLINPEIIQFSKEEKTIEEGCLSIPEIREEITRPETIKVKFKDANFVDTEMEVGKMLARVMQHEIDHLNGVFFIDHLSAVKRRMLKGGLEKIKRGEVETDYLLASKKQPVLT
jgi:peptide deformylase